MNSSGIKRGLAGSAITALAISGLPFLASSASATPISDTTATADDVVLYSAQAGGVSDRFDGTNESFSLVAGGGANVDSVLFQYQATSTTGDWNDVPGGAVARNDDGVFQLDWKNVPADVTAVRAVANTGDIDANLTVATVADATASTVELATEGALGVFQAPYTDDASPAAGTARGGDYVGVTGTTSGETASVTVADASHGTGATVTESATDADETTGNTSGGVFDAILDINGYDYSNGSEPNQIALNAATANTDDAEGSTLYIQKIADITAVPANQEVSDASDAEILLTVTDQRTNPVANAEVGYYVADDAATTGTDEEQNVVLGYTDANGEFMVDTSGFTEGGDYSFYANTTDEDDYEASIDPLDTATVTTYDPALESVEIVNERDRSAFDIDELDDADDFTIETRDQRGNLIGEDFTEYRYVVDPAATGEDTQTSEWIAAPTTGDGEFEVPALNDALYNSAFPGTSAGAELPVGSYTLEARRRNVGGTGLKNATPETFKAGEAEITFAEGKSANAVVEEDIVLEGTLALGDGTTLKGRAIQLSFEDREDARFVDSDSAEADGTGSNAEAITGANGGFAVTVDDQAGPSNVADNPEVATVNAIAEEAANDTDSLQGNNGPDDSTVANDPANAEAEIDVNFDKQAEVDSIDINTDVLDPRNVDSTIAGPGVPVDLDITVQDADNNDLVDYPVTVTVDQGFLSPNAESVNDLTLAEDQDDEGDLWGYFQNDGQSDEVSTGDNAEAGTVVAIEDNDGFDDDGIVVATVTVTAGGVTETETIRFDARTLLNTSDVELVRADGEPAGDVETTDEVDLNLFVYDQFGNLVGDQIARISDDSTVADFRTDEDFDRTASDFTTSGTGITAFSDAPAVQTLFAALQVSEVLVDNNENADDNGTRNISEASEPIVWVEEEVIVDPMNCDGVNPSVLIAGESNGPRKDVVRFQTEDCAVGDEVTLYKIRGKKSEGNKRLVKIRSTESTEDGNLTFKVADRNGNQRTRFIAKVRDTSDYGTAKSNTQKLR